MSSKLQPAGKNLPLDENAIAAGDRAGSDRTIFLVFCAVAVLIAVFLPLQHDYIHYMTQWELVLAGKDPWTTIDPDFNTSNAYGPVHNLFAYLYALGATLPRVFSALLLLIGIGGIYNRLLSGGQGGQAGQGSLLAFHLAITTNGLIILAGFVYGTNDTVAAALVAFAVLARLDRRFWIAGLCLGIAGALKYYPLVLAPFFMFDGNRLRLQIAAGAALAFAAIMAWAWFVWGTTVFEPLLFASDRGPKSLSVLRALYSHPWLIGEERLGWLIGKNSVFVLGIYLASIPVLWRLGANWLEASVIGLLVVLTVYKVGHAQFYLPWLVLVAALPLSGTQSASRMARYCVPVALFLSLYWIVFHVANTSRAFALLDANVGFVFPLIALCTIGLSVAQDRQRRGFIPRIF